MSHYIKKCRICDVIMGQCRCAGDKTVIWDTCDKCEQASLELKAVGEFIVRELQAELSQANEAHSLTTQRLSEANQKNNELKKEVRFCRDRNFTETDLRFREIQEELLQGVDLHIGSWSAQDIDSLKCSLPLDRAHILWSPLSLNGVLNRLFATLDLANKRLGEYEKVIKYAREYTKSCSTWNLTQMEEALKALQDGGGKKC